MKAIINYIKQAKRDIKNFNDKGNKVGAKDARDSLKRNLEKYLKSGLTLVEKIKLLKAYTNSENGKKRIDTIRNFDNFEIKKTTVKGYYKANKGYENIPSISIRTDNVLVSLGSVR